MNSFEALTQRKLAIRLKAEIEERGMNLATGTATDWADYRARANYIRALFDVIEWMREVETELTKPEGENVSRS